MSLKNLFTSEFPNYLQITANNWNGLVTSGLTGAGVGSISNTDGNIDFSSSTGPVIANLNTDLNISGLSIGPSGMNYTLPPLRGLNNQILTTTSSGLCIWANGATGSSGVSSLGTSGSNLTLSGSTGDISINLGTDLDITTLNTTGAITSDANITAKLGFNVVPPGGTGFYALPLQSNGMTGQILTDNGDGTTDFIDPPALTYLSLYYNTNSTQTFASFMSDIPTNSSYNIFLSGGETDYPPETAVPITITSNVNIIGVGSQSNGFVLVPGTGIYTSIYNNITLNTPNRYMKLSNICFNQNSINCIVSGLFENCAFTNFNNTYNIHTINPCLGCVFNNCYFDNFSTLNDTVGVIYNNCTFGYGSLINNPSGSYVNVTNYNTTNVIPYNLISGNLITNYFNDGVNSVISDNITAKSSLSVGATGTNYSLPSIRGSSGQFLTTDSSGVCSWANTNTLYSNTLYVNDGVNDIQSAIDSAAAGTAIYMSAGSYGGSVVSMTNKSNLTIICPYGQGTCTELANRGMTINNSNNVIQISNLQFGASSNLSASSGKYERCNFTGTSTITFGSQTSTGFIIVENCDFTSTCTIVVDATFANVIYFINCNFGGATLNFQQATSVQCIITNCVGLTTYNPTNATMLAYTALTSGLSQANATNVNTTNLTVDNLLYPTPTVASTILEYNGSILNWVPQSGIPTPKTWTQSIAFQISTTTLPLAFSLDMTFKQDPITLVNSVYIAYGGISPALLQYQTYNEQVSLEPINDTLNPEGNSLWFDGTYNYQFANTFGYQLTPAGTVSQKYYFTWSIDGAGFIHVNTTAPSFLSGFIWWYSACPDASGNPYPHNASGLYTLKDNSA